jgi:NAD(P)-dependent dehydrogenase (short-subunit alcohol dehydrogenase family)
VISVNLKSMFLTCKYTLPFMVQQGQGAIVNISSIASIRYTGYASVSYNASKGAVNQLTQNIAVPRAFYLTKARFNGGKALTACATGYHMAPIWEIKDTTLLQYNNTLGRTDGDSTFGGPPSSTTTDSTGIGWIRTGSDLASCKKWSSSSASDTGTEGTLSINGTGQPVWVVGNGGNCNAVASGTHQGVWCVQN